MHGTIFCNSGLNDSFGGSHGFKEFDRTVQGTSDETRRDAELGGRVGAVLEIAGPRAGQHPASGSQPGKGQRYHGVMRQRPGRCRASDGIHSDCTARLSRPRAAFFNNRSAGYNKSSIRRHFSGGSAFESPIEEVRGPMRPPQRVQSRRGWSWRRSRRLRALQSAVRHLASFAESQSAHPPVRPKPRRFAAAAGDWARSAANELDLALAC